MGILSIDTRKIDYEFVWESLNLTNDQKEDAEKIIENYHSLELESEEGLEYGLLQEGIKDKEIIQLLVKYGILTSDGNNPDKFKLEPLVLAYREIILASHKIEKFDLEGFLDKYRKIN